MNDKMVLAGLAGLLVVLLVTGSFFWEEPGEKELQRFEETRDLMDTYVTIIVYAENRGTAETAMDAAYESMEETIAIANRFDPSSEISRLNTNGTLENASSELVEMLELSIYYWNVTGGAFDITLLPLLDLWQYMGPDSPFNLFTLAPSLSTDLDSGNLTTGVESSFAFHGYELNMTTDLVEVNNATQEWTVTHQTAWGGTVDYMITEEAGGLEVSTLFFWNVEPNKQNEYIGQKMPLVGSDKIAIEGSNITLMPGMRLTLDGMAKGYVVDAALETLKERGITSALVDAGGDIGTMGTKPGGGWKTGLRDPEDESRSVAEFELSGQAIATSGNYERYFNETYEVGHIMDPATGRDVFECSSSTIIADNCTVADILATAIFVLGTEDGMALVDTLSDVEALLLGYDDPQDLFPSSGLAQYMLGTYTE